jgi:hypothetical protein
MPHTVNSPVWLSMLTCVTCMGFVGVEIVGRRGEPSMLLMKVEKVPFFFAPPERRFFAPSPLPSLYRFVFGLPVEGGVVSILLLNDRDCRSSRFRD